MQASQSPLQHELEGEIVRNETIFLGMLFSEVFSFFFFIFNQILQYKLLI